MGAPWWWWALGALLAATLIGAVLAYVDAWTALAFSVAVVLGGAALLVGYTLKVQVDDEALTVGRNRLEGRYIADAEAFDGEAARRVTGPEADRTAFLQTRPYAGGIVRVTLDDPADPHGCWLISTRHPKELAEAVRTMCEEDGVVRRMMS